MIGQRSVAFDWDERTSGASVYVADLRPDGLCYAAVLRSSRPHARIVTLDAAPARAIEGVLAVITAEDLDDARYIHHGGPLADRPVLAGSVVRYVGEEIAAVAAETPEIARAAVEAIRIRYRDLPVVTDVHAALRSSSPALHARTSGHNVSIHTRRTFGTPPGADESDVVVTGTYRFARQAHVSMETNGTLAHWDEEARKLHVWSSTQSPFFVRKELAHVLGLEKSDVIAHEVAVGGGFGAKSKICEHEALASLLSMRTGRPVRLVLDRVEEFSATKSRHEFTTTLTTTATSTGTITGHRAEVLVDNGAYNHTGPSVMGAGMAMLASLYPTQGVAIDARLVDTNKVPGGQFRGYGGPQATFAVEVQVDEVADALGIDPIDLRLRNLHGAGSVTHAGLRLGTTELAACLTTVREAIGWDAKRSLGGTGRGVGVAIGMHPSGARTYPDANRSSARIDLDAAGRVVVRFGGADPGTGQRVILAQIAAQELGIPVDSVTVTMMDTDRTPIDMGAWSSRGTMMGGNAVLAAAQEMAAALRGWASEKLAVAVEDVMLADGAAVSGSERIEIGDLVASFGPVEGTLSVEREIEVDAELVDPATGVANVSTAYAMAAHAVEVEVDLDTGQVRVLRYVAAHDVGRAINPMLVEGQIAGGVVMGLGAALSEELLHEGGRTVNPTYLHYAVPRASDVPRIDVRIVEGEDPSGPYGAKSVGEIGIVPVAAAVANAVSHAIGRRIREIPITPEKIVTVPDDGLIARIRRYRLWRRPVRWWIASLRALYPLGVHALLHRFGPVRRGPQDGATDIRSIERCDDPTAASSRLSAGDAQIIAGGTDLMPARQQGFGHAPVLVDITRGEAFRRITASTEGIRIGAAVTLAELIDQAPRHGLHVMATAAERIASPQIRAAATVVGNLCQEKRCWFFRNGFDCYKRSGAARPCYAVMGDHRFHHAVLDAHRCQAVGPSDLATVLAMLDARIAVRDPRGAIRSVSIDAFYRGPGETTLRSDDLVLHVDVPLPPEGSRHAFQKLALTQGDFSVAAVAVRGTIDERGRATDLRVVLGGVGPVPHRAVRVEQALLGRSVDRDAILSAAARWERDAHPLPANAWKVPATTALVERALTEVLGPPDAGAPRGRSDGGG